MAHQVSADSPHHRTTVKAIATHQAPPASPPGAGGAPATMLHQPSLLSPALVQLTSVSWCWCSPGAGRGAAPAPAHHCTRAEAAGANTPHFHQHQCTSTPATVHQYIRPTLHQRKYTRSQSLKAVATAASCRGTFWTSGEHFGPKFIQFG